MAHLLTDPFHTQRRTEAEARAEITKRRLEDRWHREGWRDCGHCDGTGRTEDAACIECDGKGQVKLPFFDWLDEITHESHGNRRVILGDEMKGAAE